jgi:predicted nicotinamide N-methyase
VRDRGHARSVPPRCTAVDIDPHAAAAIGLNARANRQKIDVVAMTILGDLRRTSM